MCARELLPPPRHRWQLVDSASVQVRFILDLTARNKAGPGTQHTMNSLPTASNESKVGEASAVVQEQTILSGSDCRTHNAPAADLKESADRLCLRAAVVMRKGQTQNPSAACVVYAVRAAESHGREGNRRQHA
jgi:hypothetical protein